MKPSRTIAASFIAMRLQIARACKIDVETVLKNTGLTEDILLQPDIRLTEEQDRAVWRELVTLTQDEALGLKIGQHTSISGLGIIGYIVMNSPTIIEGVRRAFQYENLLTDIIHSDIVEESDRISHVITFTGEWEPEYRYVVDDILSSIKSLTYALAVKPVEPLILALDFQYPTPTDLTPYRTIFGNVPLYFNRPNSRCIFNKETIQMPLVGANPSLLPMFEEQAKTLIERYNRDRLSDRVRQAIAESLQGQLPIVEDIATRLIVSPRSLQRQLQEEGTSYQTLLNEVRQDLAIAYLQKQNLNKTEIAYLLGFSEVSTFSRTFKRWTGQSPSTFQKESQIKSG